VNVAQCRSATHAFSDDNQFSLPLMDFRRTKRRKLVLTPPVSHYTVRENITGLESIQTLRS